MNILARIKQVLPQEDPMMVVLLVTFDLFVAGCVLQYCLTV